MRADHDGVVRKPRSVISADTRVEQWRDRLVELADDEIEGGGDELGIIDITAETAGLLQHAVDKALVQLERELVTRFAGEIAALSTKLAAVEAERRADQERHRSEVAGLCADLARQRKSAAAEAERSRDEVTLLHNELAELRSVDRLRQSRAGRAHDARVTLKLARAELAREAKGAA
jgi:hypothetical protein